MKLSSFTSSALYFSTEPTFVSTYLSFFRPLNISDHHINLPIHSRREPVVASTPSKSQYSGSRSTDVSCKPLISSNMYRIDISQKMWVDGDGVADEKAAKPVTKVPVSILTFAKMWFFSEQWPSSFEPKPNQNISTTLWQERNIT